ncbi:MAG: DegT/DnrJ/EryC1/StrS family aminotransferase, partial [bacterium]|nr:DegT/DnrJ/EryC1/StrS family aminotransferase [bacterium]
MKRSKFLIFGAPRFFQEELKEILETLRSGWWGTGPKCQQFEADFCRYTHAKHAVSVNSATAAMHLGLNILGVGPGDEVITTPLTFVSTANVIIHTGAKPVFADVNKQTGNIDPKEIVKKITKKTKAIIPVHLHGRPCQMDEINKIAKKNKLFVLEDAAHATEAWYHGKKIGSISDLTAFSFYVTKNVATGEGGMLTTNNKTWADICRVRRLHGISADAWKRYSAEGYKPYEAIYPGFKYNMMDLQASLGIHQLKRAKANLKIRNKYWKLYTQAFTKLDGVIPPTPFEPKTVHAMHLYAINLELDKLTINRNQFIDALKDENIGAGVHFSALHLHQYYRKTFGYKRGGFPNAEWIGDRTVSLPFYPHMSQ